MLGRQAGFGFVELARLGGGEKKGFQKRVLIVLVEVALRVGDGGSQIISKTGEVE